MKRVVISILISALISSCLITGCSGTTPTTNDSATGGTTEAAPVYADESFIADLSSGLMKRWDKSDELDKKIADGSVTMGSSEYKQGLTDCVNAELEMINKYRNESFEDGKLQELAVSYINAVNDQMKALEDFNTAVYDSEWQAAYDKRSKLLVTLISDYNLTVDEAHQDQLQQFKSYGNQVQQAEDNQGKVDELINSFDFEETNNDYGYKTYTAIVENTTGIDFESFSVNINLLDEDGILVETAYATFKNWSSGVKAKFEFSTDKDFNSTEVHAEYISDTNGVQYK